MCTRDRCRRLTVLIAVLVSLAGLGPAVTAAARLLRGGVEAGAPAAVSVARRPNVLLIITDDPGYGDLGFRR
jgi:hypothetical protein